MAVSGSVVSVHPEDLKEGGGKLRETLELWNCREGPVQYNAWQSAYIFPVAQGAWRD